MTVASYNLQYENYYVIRRFHATSYTFARVFAKSVHFGLDAPKIIDCFVTTFNIFFEDTYEHTFFFSLLRSAYIAFIATIVTALLHDMRKQSAMMHTPCGRASCLHVIAHNSMYVFSSCVEFS